MLPATLAQDVKQQVRHYLEATFPMRKPEMEVALNTFFNDPENGIFKGPWLQLRRPFRAASNNGEQFFDLSVPFMPFMHQWQSWQRLTSKNNQPKATLVTTGTGSGKTECFLYPLLDHCLRDYESGKRQGIKAIVLYPMNALASDQAGRFAEEILKSDQLSYEHDQNGKKVRKAKIRVGLYTGRMQLGKEGSKEDIANPNETTYSEVQIIPAEKTGGKPAYVAITNREAMQQNPPDILLTNYKMLDYLLMRPKDKDIWRFNAEDYDLLKYLVLDELHTYDGAQGADVACLIRRLKERLSLAKNKLCIVGTSATIANSDNEDETTQDPLNQLCSFAGSLFEESIDNSAVILEDRLPISRVLHSPLNESYILPDVALCSPLDKEQADDYAKRMAGLFAAPVFPVSESCSELKSLLTQGFLSPLCLQELDDLTLWKLALGEWLRSHPLFAAILKFTESGVVRWDSLLRQLARDDFIFRAVKGFQLRSLVLQAFLALVAQARELRSGRPFPLVPTQVQLWLRELRRIGLEVSQEPKFRWLDEPLNDKQQLPVVHCKECGELGWVGLLDPDETSKVEQKVAGFVLEGDPQKVYQGWGFDHLASDKLVILSPWIEGDDPIAADGQIESKMTRYYLASGSLVVRQGEGLCPLTDEKTFAVKVSRERRQREKDNQWYGIRRCPQCQAEDSMMFIGSRAATISSVAIDEVFGSTRNNDPKLLAFTDSVQDASHRAGFFSSRTYHFTFRTALQHVIDAAGDQGLALNQVGSTLIQYWCQSEAGRPGSIRELMATLIPPDLREYRSYLAFRNNPDQHEPAPALLNDFINRLNWEASSEFGLMLSHGRTMEGQSSATLGWDENILDETVSRLRLSLSAISPALEQISDRGFLQWIYGVLYRSRLRGALYHPYLDAYAIQNYWGKYPFGKTVSGRETYPPAGRYKPRLMVTERDKFHEHVLAPSTKGSNAPWQIVWARRVLDVPSVDDNTLIDLLAALLDVGKETGLFHCVHTDGHKAYFALNTGAARLYSKGEKIICDASSDTLFRPSSEVAFWLDSPSMNYADQHKYTGYQMADFNDRERYYRDRYRKGALRRVFAFEHTGLLTTDERESLEMQFNAGGHADDPNVLTATSTLEMGIDIGDLSTTMLCSIPPNVASYLQRIGRAGRRTGTALVIAVINQRPHDLFFFARPDDLLNGDVEPPGCWLDALAVIMRQYLAYCIDQAVGRGIITDLPATGKQLFDEVITNKSGHIPQLLEWVTLNETELQDNFLKRFQHDFIIGSDTPDQFKRETATERLHKNISRAAQEFNTQREILTNARRRLKDQEKTLDHRVEKEALDEIEREQRILRARTRKLGEISALEVLIEHGLLPNYAFPERGVRFSGSTYNRYSQAKVTSASTTNKTSKDKPKTFEIVRSGASAIRELAPGNHFYTHSHVFDIQQLEVGSKNDRLIEYWAVCGQCGHMRVRDEVTKPDSVPACPQCGYDGIQSQTDLDQHRACLPFHRSQSVSYMEYYESLSGDKGEERENEFYRLVSSFDYSGALAKGAVADDSLPFGIEYRSAIKMREINTGYADSPVEVAFGVDTDVPEGFEVCTGCGVAVESGQSRKGVKHRKSCAGRRKHDELQRQGKPGDPFEWTKTWLYRELRSEAIRLLLPDVEPEDLDTLEAAIYLGMRLRFQGDPAHLIVKPQIIPDHREDITRNYLVLMDAVPGGTGYLKEMFQDKDSQGREGEGIVEVLRLAKNALETCQCRHLQQTATEIDGCYRCIRTYHMQYKADNISRERGIVLLGDLLEAADKRLVKETLDDVKIEALFGSVLEKRFADKLQQWVIAEDGKWSETLINGKRGFQFVFGTPERAWELEIQPQLSSVHGVSIPCQPDFMMRCDDGAVKPVAIFTDGFEPHVHPGEAESRLTDDVQKRRAILDSGLYHVWNISWNDLSSDIEERKLSFLHEPVVENVLKKNATNSLRRKDIPVPDISMVTSNSWQQFKAYLSCPLEEAWKTLAESASGVFMGSFALQGKGGDLSQLKQALELWRSGYAATNISEGDWVWLSKIAISEDMLAYALAEELSIGQYERLRIALRLDDSESERSKEKTYLLRWRQFLAMFNLFQFADHFIVFSTTEVAEEIAPEFEIELGDQLLPEWEELLEDVSSSLDPLVRLMATVGCDLPEIEYYADDVANEVFAELAWPDVDQPIAILMGDQAFFTNKWNEAGWKTITDKIIAADGMESIVSQLPQHAKQGDK